MKKIFIQCMQYEYDFFNEVYEFFQNKIIYDNNKLFIKF